MPSYCDNLHLLLSYNSSITDIEHSPNNTASATNSPIETVTTIHYIYIYIYIYIYKRSAHICLFIRKHTHIFSFVHNTIPEIFMSFLSISWAPSVAWGLVSSVDRPLLVSSILIERPTLLDLVWNWMKERDWCLNYFITSSTLATTPQGLSHQGIFARVTGMQIA